VVRQYRGRNERIGSRYLKRMVSWLLLGLLCIICFFIFSFGLSAIKPGFSLLIISNPVTLIYWPEDQHKIEVMKIPSNMAIDAADGYGTYTLESLWRLGTIDKKSGAIIMRSLSETLGIPITWYIAPRNPDFDTVDNVTHIVSQNISLGKIVDFTRGKYISNINWWDYIRLSKNLTFKYIDSTNTLDLKDNLAYDIRDLPDNSQIYIINPDKIDKLLGNDFELDSIRGESLSVAVYNTTTSMGLATKLGRMLNRLGLTVLTVGNENYPIQSCEITAQADVLQSKTVNLLQQLFQCHTIVSTQTARTDITIRIANDYIQDIKSLKNLGNN
jgi:hypothetical protein